VSHPATLWQLEPHTHGKHLVLRKYLEAWLPIMSSWSGRILFVDGFAGPGEYEGGEEGSPIIAVNALTAYSSLTPLAAEVVFIFIEKEPDRADHLRGMLARLTLPSRTTVEVVTGAFDDTLTSVLNDVDAQSSHLAPCFVMVDPFGVAGTPMTVLRRILGKRRAGSHSSAHGVGRPAGPTPLGAILALASGRLAHGAAARSSIPLRLFVPG
jgi:three-Cys-motif partner protein